MPALVKKLYFCFERLFSIEGHVKNIPYNMENNGMPWQHHLKNTTKVTYISHQTHQMSSYLD